MLKLATGIMQDNYPENLGKSHICNAPMLFAGVWKIVSKFLDEKTVAKVNIHRYGSAELLEEIEED